VVIAYGPFFVEEMRSLDAPTRKLVLLAMLDIESNPWTSTPTRCELPPMWRPGTFCQSVGRFNVTYCREGDQSLRFLHVRANSQPGFPDAM